MSIFERNLIKNSYKIILLSKHIKEEIEKYYKIFYNKYVYIYNWYDTLNKKQQKEKTKNKKIEILFVSNAHRVKWIDILEKIAKELENENIEFNIIGAEYNNIKQKNIHYLWKLSRNDVYKNMRESDIFFFPSYREWQPLVVFEAMSQWCIPLISWECHMDMLEKGLFKGFISHKNDRKFYLKKINYFINNTDKIDTYKKLAIKTISPYSRKNQTDKYYKFIKKEI